MQRESMEFDIVIVGAGPAGLSTAIHLAQLSKEKNIPVNICVLEKGSEVGSHIISGAILETRALTELIPDWQEQEAPITVKVAKDQFCLLSERHTYRLPLPPLMQNHNNHIISLGELCQWLGRYAESLGINIFPGFSANKPLFNENKTALIGVQTGDMGLNKLGEHTDRFQAGLNLFARQIILAEGSRGSLSQEIIDFFNLRQHSDCQSYAIGIKELWKIPIEKHELVNLTKV